MRINKYIANQTGLARRQVDQLIQTNKVKINKKWATLGQQVETGDQIEIYQNQAWQVHILSDLQDQTILFYKPIFCETTRVSQTRKKTVYDFLPAKFSHLKPAGRLDYMSEGLLVFSSNGELIKQLSHPRFACHKVYIVGLKQAFSDQSLVTIQKGIKIDNYQLRPMQINLLSQSDIQKWSFLKLQPNLVWYFFGLDEGRNNQIRKVCKSQNREVKRLIRVQQGPYQLTPELKQHKYLEVKNALDKLQS